MKRKEFDKQLTGLLKTKKQSTTMTTDKKYFYIEIKDYDTNEVVKRLDATDKSEISRQNIETGMSTNLNHTKYYTHSFESVNELPKI